MADSNTTREGNGKGDDKDILEQARKHWDAVYDREHRNMELAYADMTFLAGDNLSQWSDDDKKRRVGRPTLQDNRLPQFVQQITGDIRQMKPSIKVVPVDDQGDEKVADLYGGMIRYIENRSDASAVYFGAADTQVACGMSHWRIDTEYADDSTLNTEIRINPVDDGIAVMWDANSKLPTRQDAGHCFVPVDMTRAAFEQRWPDATPSDFADTNWTHNAAWVADDYIRVAEYWVKKPAKKKVAVGLDGSVTALDDATPEVLAYLAQQGARVEERETTTVCRYLITASEVLEGPKEWPGRFIPIVPVIGREFRIGRKIVRKGIVRDAMDPQRMVNYFHSAHSETIALQPKSPYMVTELNVAKYQRLWEGANTDNSPYLVFTPDPQNGGAAPQRIAPPVSSSGVIEGLQLAVESLKAVTGIYDASLGARSNETSGKAIMARQREGDVGSYVYIDNFARAISTTGRILVDLIPHIYDTERTIRIMGEDGKIDLMEINAAKGLDPQTGATIYENDMTVGSYDVVTTIGPSYTTKREEAKEGMIAFLQAAPQAAPLVLDLVAKAQDWPMADDFAKRLRSQLPPKIIQMEEMEKQGAPPEQIQAMVNQAEPPPPDPRMMKVQADVELKAQQQQFDQQKAMADLQIQVQEIAQKSEQAQQQFFAQMQQMFLDSQTKIEVAQINAGVGMHKNIIQAGVSQMDSEIGAAIEHRKIDAAAETARYQADRPQNS